LYFFSSLASIHTLLILKVPVDRHRRRLEDFHILAHSREHE
jgi:hypothetical protein